MNENNIEKKELKFEISHKEIDEFIKRKKGEGNEFEISTYDIARIHAHVSPNGENCKECHRKVVEVGIIKDFNEDIDDEKS